MDHIHCMMSLIISPSLLLLFVDGVSIAFSGSWEEVTLQGKHNMFLTELDSPNTTCMQKPESYVSSAILKFRLLALLALISVSNVF